MPDPITYLKALVAAAGASAVVALALRLILRRTSFSATAVVPLLAFAGGLVVGYRVLEFAGTWPPASALNRFLMLVLPATLFVELLATLAGIQANALNSQNADKSALPAPSLAHPSVRFLGRLAGTLRLGLLMLAGPVLLHGSVYLRGVESGHAEAWTPVMTGTMFCLSFALLTATITSLDHLSRHSAAGSIPLSIAMAIVSAGVATMLAGYIKGGAAAIPLAAALMGTTFASPLFRPFTRISEGKAQHGVISIGVVGLFSLLCIGRFFGQLTSLTAIVIFLSPLLCWISEVPRLRPRTAWQTALLRLVVVSIPLAMVLITAKKDFDQKMAPLLSSLPSCRLTCLRSALCTHELPMRTSSGG